MTPYNCIDHIRLGPRPEPTPEENARAVDRLAEEMKSKMEAMKMTVRAKFVVQEKREHNFSQGKTIILRPQYDTTIPEDQRFAKATPSGELTMFVDNPTAEAALEMGKAYYIDIMPAE